MTQADISLINIAVMAFVAWNIPLQLIPVMIWFERKGSAIIQDRWGPIRANIGGVRIFGMLHNIADVVKLLMKEDVTPYHVQKFYYTLAPFWAMTVALLPLMLIPIAAPINVAGYDLRFQVADYESGLLMVFA
ncbi:MAG: NADH-quinone oxidoreductase subunit H, partial [Spirochaetae bacterium HGW-Spirochaetae-10]